MTPELFTRYLTAFVDAFTSEDTLKAEAIVQALTKGIHLHVRTKAAELYRTNMRTKLNEYLNDTEFEALHSNQSLMPWRCLICWRRLAMWTSETRRDRPWTVIRKPRGKWASK
eukprot:c20716_g2_i2.p2 GENE.c20716_g2_i2~~c20716_g2_i2.p2  ORF type:complete len:113 (-),score=21.34 c20716_g2_i2:406-744(-)